MLLHLGFCKVDIYLKALREEFGSLCGVLHQEVAHDDVGSHLVEVAGAEVEQLLILSFLDCGGAGVELGGHCLE